MHQRCLWLKSCSVLFFVFLLSHTYQRTVAIRVLGWDLEDKKHSSWWSAIEGALFNLFRCIEQGTVLEPNPTLPAVRWVCVTYIRLLMGTIQLVLAMAALLLVKVTWRWLLWPKAVGHQAPPSLHCLRPQGHCQGDRWGVALVWPPWEAAGCGVERVSHVRQASPQKKA